MLNLNISSNTKRFSIFILGDLNQPTFGSCLSLFKVSKLITLFLFTLHCLSLDVFQRLSV